MNQEDCTQILFAFFESLMPLHENEREFMKERFVSSLYRRKQVLLKEGDYCKYYYFVVKGCLRMYKIAPNGNMHIIKFAPENTWITNIGSYYYLKPFDQKPSNLNIDALEQTIVMQIKMFDLIALFHYIPRLNHIFRVQTENELAMLQQRHIQTISSSAEERYQLFIETYPQLLNRLPLTQIASFLGITPEFLSRLRSRQLKSSNKKS